MNITVFNIYDKWDDRVGTFYYDERYDPVYKNLSPEEIERRLDSLVKKWNTGTQATRSLAVYLYSYGYIQIIPKRIGTPVAPIENEILTEN